MDSNKANTRLAKMMARALSPDAHILEQITKIEQHEDKVFVYFGEECVLLSVEKYGVGDSMEEVMSEIEKIALTNGIGVVVSPFGASKITVELTVTGRMYDVPVADAVEWFCECIARRVPSFFGEVK